MKANELRIVNYVSYFNDVVKIKSIYKENSQYYIQAFRKNTEYNNVIDSFKPIPLTEEWLLKAGYEYISEIDGYADGKHVAYLHADGIVFHPF